MIGRILDEKSSLYLFDYDWQDLGREEFVIFTKYSFVDDDTEMTGKNRVCDIYLHHMVRDSDNVIFGFMNDGALILIRVCEIWIEEFVIDSVPTACLSGHMIMMGSEIITVRDITITEFV